MSDSVGEVMEHITAPALPSTNPLVSAICITKCLRVTPGQLRGLPAQLGCSESSSYPRHLKLWRVVPMMEA